MVLQGQVVNENHYIFPTRVRMATKFGRMINYLNGLLIMKSLDPFIMWTCEIAWQTKSVISLIPKCLQPQNVVGYWPTLRGSYVCSHLTLQLGGVVRSKDKLKTYLYYYNSYGQETWQSGDMPWRASTYKVTWFLNQVVL